MAARGADVHTRGGGARAMSAVVHPGLAIALTSVLALLISMLGFAAVMKARDTAGIARWLVDLGFDDGRTLAILLVIVDGILMGLLIFALIGAVPAGLATGGIALMVLGGMFARRYAGRPCPCIGGRHAKWAGSFAVAMAVLVGLDFVIRSAGGAVPVPVPWGWALSCMAGAAGGGVALLLDRRVLAGESVGLPPAQMSSVWTALPPMAGEGGTLIILFASVNCAGCMRALEQLADFTPQPHHRVLVDVGRRLPGVASVGGLQVASIEPSLRRMLGVVATPCLLVLRKGRVQGKRWVGERQVSRAITTLLERM